MDWMGCSCQQCKDERCLIWFPRLHWFGPSEVGSDASDMLPVAHGPEPPHRRENPTSFDLIGAFDGGGRSEPVSNAQIPC
jgi:hypothetical protein